MRSLRDIVAIISNNAFNNPSNDTTKISMRSILKAHRWVGPPPKVLSFRSIAERYDNNGENIIRFLSYNTALLEIVINPEEIGAIAGGIVGAASGPLWLLIHGVTGGVIGKITGEIIEGLGGKKDITIYKIQPECGARAKELGLELSKTVTLAPGLKKRYEIISLCEAFTNEGQGNIHAGIPEYICNAAQGDQIHRKGSGLYVLVNPYRKIMETKSIAFSYQGQLDNDADAWSRKGVLLTRIYVGVGVIDLYSTHLYAGGGLPGAKEVPRGLQNERRAKQLDEFIKFFKETHLKQNVAVFCGDFNMNRAEFSAKMSELKLSFCENNAGTTISFDPNTVIDHILVENPTPDHSFMLDVSILRIKELRRSNPTNDNADLKKYLSDHLGLDVILIPSKKPKCNSN